MYKYYALAFKLPTNCEETNIFFRGKLERVSDLVTIQLGTDLTIYLLYTNTNITIL